MGAEKRYLKLEGRGTLLLKSPAPTLSNHDSFQSEIPPMITATRKQLTVVKGIARFAMVTVGRPENHDAAQLVSSPEIILSGRPVQTLTNEHRAVISAAQEGMREAENKLEWQTPQHVALTIEGLDVDGVDADATRIAAREATIELIQKSPRIPKS